MSRLSKNMSQEPLTHEIIVSLRQDHKYNLR